MINLLILFVARPLLWLRYRVQVRGLGKIAIRGRGGILFLPNHPALIDPVILVCRLYGRFRTRALADRSHPQREPLKRLLRRWVEANAADRRFASGGAAKLTPQVRRQLAQLGYAGDREESRRLSTERWLEILSEADRST